MTANPTITQNKFTYGRMFDLENPVGTPPDLAALTEKLNAISEKLDALALDVLAEEMARSRPRKDSKIPAGYTYLGQFIDHDISLDSASEMPPWRVRPDEIPGIYNKRIPHFDLETLYGIDKPPSEETPVVRSTVRKPNSAHLNLGETTFIKLECKLKVPTDHDLPRNSEKPPLANIVDRRNDENLLVAQTHVAFIKFHNAIADKIERENTDQKFENNDEIFDEARKRTIRYYQHIVLRDFLPKIVKTEVLTEQFIKEPNKFYDAKKNNLFVPFEYSVAAFRMGHSMVRHEYHINSFKSVNLSGLNTFTGTRANPRKTFPGADPPMMGKRSLPNDWIVNWNLFYDIDGSKKLPKFNRAFKINTEISFPLGMLAPSMKFERMFSLPALDLFRGKLLSLPTGQKIAEEMKKKVEIKPLAAADIARLLHPSLRNIFQADTPLWFYILAEAQKNEDGERLGDVGSHLVAGTFVELLKESVFSIIKDPLTDEERKFVDLQAGADFGMPEMLKFIERNEPNFLDPNPM